MSLAAQRDQGVERGGRQLSRTSPAQLEPVELAVSEALAVGIVAVELAAAPQGPSKSHWTVPHQTIELQHRGQDFVRDHRAFESPVLLPLLGALAIVAEGS